MLRLLFEIFATLKKSSRGNFIIVSISQFFLLLFELLFLATIAPTLSILLSDDSQVIESFMKYLPENFSEFNSVNFASIFLISLVIVKFLYSSFQTYFQNLFLTNITAELSNKLYSKYLNSTYFFHIKNDSSKLYEKVFIETGQFRDFTSAVLSIISEILFLSSILVILIYFSPLVTVSSVVYLSIILGFFYLLTRGKSYKWGKERLNLDGKLTKDIIESFNSIKEIIVYNKSAHFIELIKNQNEDKSRLNAKQLTIVQFPKYCLELAMIFGLFLLIYLFKRFEYSDSQIFNIIGFLVVCLFKILPSFNKIILSFNIIKFNQSSLSIVSQALKTTGNDISPNRDTSITFSNSIELKNVSFSFDEENKILKNLNFKIKKGEKICVIGDSGSGKSTLINLLLGLFETTDGSIISDGKRIHSYNQSWFDKIGYVPQDVLVNNDTILNNITFNDEIKDEEKIVKILRQVGLEKFLENNYYSNINIGQNGRNISGGQRQRIGVARSLYGDKEILVFDEATSSLDANTEQNIFDSIVNIKNLTLVYSTHNKDLIKYADKVLNLNELDYYN